MLKVSHGGIEISQSYNITIQRHNIFSWKTVFHFPKKKKLSTTLQRYHS